MQKISFILLYAMLSSMAIMEIAHAETSFCHTLAIQITNYTGQTCNLAYYEIALGKLDRGTIIPHSIVNEDSKSFSMSGKGGNSLLLTYLCGNNIIKFQSKQDLCFLNAGKITGEALYAKNIRATYEAIKGSYWGERYGIIIWTLNNVPPN